jgi:uncharacterized iron-regulated protein
MSNHHLLGKYIQVHPVWRITAILLVALLAVHHHVPAGNNGYQLYDGHTGREVSLKKMLRKLKRADVVLFGETHNSVLDHELQMQLAAGFLRKGKDRLILGAEMFETDDQLVVDEFLSGLITEKHLVYEAKTWRNYETDYAPFLRFAKEHGLSFIATNVPRRYANLVARQGMEALQALQPEALRLMAPLPVLVDLKLSSYREMLTMMEGHLGPETDPVQMVQAQALKDATMAHFIQRNCAEDALFFHLNGSFHSDHHQGIAHYLGLSNPGLEIATITSVREEDMHSEMEQNMGKADFLLVVPADAPRSY